MDPESTVPEPMRGNIGGTDLGPRNIELDRQSPDILTPPSTDSGTFPNLKFSFALAHNRLQEGGWARQLTVRVANCDYISGCEYALNSRRSARIALAQGS